MATTRVFTISALLLSFSVSTSVVADTASLESDCSGGLQAFQRNVHPKVMRDCSTCHDGSRRAPAFAINDVEKSYYFLLNYVDFARIDKSLLSIRAGNGHCDLPNCDARSGVEMIEKVTQWWTQGENQCSRAGKYFTDDIELTDTLPKPDQSFSTLTWDMESLGTAFRGVKLSADVQRFTVSEGENPNTLRFRKLRLSTKARGVHLKSIKILLDRQFESAGTVYNNLDVTVNPQSNVTLSTHTLILVQKEKKNVAMSFEGLEQAATAITCRAKKDFERSVLPTLAAEKCYSCHSGGPNREAGTSPAREIYSMNLSTDELCASALQRVHLESTEHSPFFAYPLRKLFEHPGIQADPTATAKTWKRWADSETTIMKSERRLRALRGAGALQPH